MMDVCPTDLELEAFLLGRSGDDHRQAWLESHVVGCGRCSRALDRLNATDELVLAVRRVGADPVEMPAVEPFISSVKLRISPSRTFDLSAVPTNTVEEVTAYRFFAPPSSADELGRIGPYRVLRPLGAGGMGLVFVAEDERLGRPAALKVMRPLIALDAEARRRFVREARAAASLRHDNIVTVYHVEEFEGVPYLAMELLEGQSLSALLGERGKLEPAVAARLAAQVADGLAAAHARGLVHRDIKPDNLWVEPNGRVKILDFGLARSEGQQHLTHQGAIVGTPAFMSPEQARGEPAGPRSDLFSLGCVLYRMLTGRLPFEGPDTVATLLAVATQAPVPPVRLRPDVGFGLSALVMRLLEKAPAARPPSASELATLLRTLPEGTPRPTWRSVPVLAALGAILALVVVGWSLTRPTPSPTEEPTAAVSARDAEQDIAEWVHSMQGCVWVSDAAQADRFVPANQALPPLPYWVNAIEVGATPQAPLTDRDLERLRPLRRLDRLTINRSEVSDAGMKTLATLPGLKAMTNFTLKGTRVTDAGLSELAHFPNLKALDLHDSDLITDVALARLPALPNLHYLHVLRCDIGDAGLAHLRGRGLTYLGLGFCPKVTNKGIGHLLTMDKLVFLMLDGTSIDDDGLAVLGAMTRLASLSLIQTRITDSGLARLRGLKNLETISVNQTAIRGAELAQLAGLPKLTSLRLSDTKIGDGDLAPLAGFPDLQNLDLDGTAVGDAGLAYLVALAKLRRLNLAATQVTPSGVEKFRKARPGCEIITER